jgi:hypothetical protein
MKKKLIALLVITATGVAMGAYLMKVLQALDLDSVFDFDVEEEEDI